MANGIKLLLLFAASVIFFGLVVKGAWLLEAKRKRAGLSLLLAAVAFFFSYYLLTGLPVFPIGY